MSRRAFALFCAFVTILVWAGSFPAITLGLEGFDPLPLAALRFLIASTVLLLVVLLRSGLLLIMKGTDALWFGFCGFLGVALYNFLLNTGQQTTSPAAASFLIACQPVFAALVATLRFRERFGPRAWIGTGICLAGAAVLALGQPGGLEAWAGASLIFLAAACSGSFFAFQRPLIARYGPLISALWVLVCGTLWLFPWIPQGLSQLATAPTNAILALIYLGIFPGSLAYVTWMVAIGELGAAKAANLLFFMAPTAAVLSIPVIGLWPSWVTVLGGAVALVGVLIVHRSKQE